MRGAGGSGVTNQNNRLENGGMYSILPVCVCVCGTASAGSLLGMSSQFFTEFNFNYPALHDGSENKLKGNNRGSMNRGNNRGEY